MPLPDVARYHHVRKITILRTSILQNRVTSDGRSYSRSMQSNLEGRIFKIIIPAHLNTSSFWILVYSEHVGAFHAGRLRFSSAQGMTTRNDVPTVPGDFHDISINIQFLPQRVFSGVLPATVLLYFQGNTKTRRGRVCFLRLELDEGEMYCHYIYTPEYKHTLPACA